MTPDMKTLDMNTTKKPYEAPRLTKAARVSLVTAGSFDLIIPNA